MTTLTPREDAARQAVADMMAAMAEALAQPGEAGVRARLTLAVGEATVMAIARELDRGGAPYVSLCAVEIAFANALNAAVDCLVPPEHRKAALSQILQRLTVQSLFVRERQDAVFYRPVQAVEGHA